MPVNSKKNNLPRILLQSAVFVLLAYMGIRWWLDKAYLPDFEAYCPFGGLQAAGSFLTRGSLSCSMTSMQILLGGMVLAGAFVFSKLFCAFICPLGTFSEWIGKIADKFKIRFKVPESADSFLRALKYMLLFGTFYFTLSSSELFCRKFDPYYAAASGFGGDVVLLWALPAVLILILGSLFFRLFWCRYLCPFGALINIFRYAWWFGGIMLALIALSLAGIKVPFVYPLLIIVCAGYMLEIVSMNRVRPSVVRITRNTGSCTNCNLCTRKCPQGIEVAKAEKVDHIDCHLCGDCLYVCPEKDTLMINRNNNRWLPSAATVMLIGAGLLLGSFVELPTIDEKWGTQEEIATAATFRMEGLKNIKCFGSSTTFANQMKKVEGIYGVSTFVGRHEVNILYNKELYNDTTLRKILFTPERRVLATLADTEDSVSVITLRVDQFFDPYDADYLQLLLQQKTNACSYQSEFDCPVVVRIYFPASRVPDVKSLREAIESPGLTYYSENTPYTVKLNYRVVSSGTAEVISRQEYISAMAPE